MTDLPPHWPPRAPAAVIDNRATPGGIVNVWTVPASKYVIFWLRTLSITIPKMMKIIPYICVEFFMVPVDTVPAVSIPFQSEKVK